MASATHESRAPLPEVSRCDDLDWLTTEPPHDWWRPHASPLESGRRGIGWRCLPGADVTIHDSSELVVATLRVRQNFGRFRICYEQTLARDPEARGYWVGRVAVGSGERACAADTIETSLAPELATCLEQAFEPMELTGVGAGKFQIALTFHIQCREVPPGSH
jgi:hypothetical protein